MKRRKFLAVAGGTVLAATGAGYLLSDKSNFVRADVHRGAAGKIAFMADEREILFLASLAPSGHNTQPWVVQYVEPYHWIIGNDQSKWLPAVDPTQRETMLSIGAFVQNLEYAANNLGYDCQFEILAKSNQDEQVLDVRLRKVGRSPKYDVQAITARRTVRSNYLPEKLKPEDVDYLTNGETDFLHYIPSTAKEHQWLNEQTIEANRVQTYRDAAQGELANWIRFSSRDARQHLDGLTMASMEITGISGWVLRNFYGKPNVMKADFRKQSLDTVRQQVAQSAGWLLITSKDHTVGTLLESGRRMQRLFLKVRGKGIAIHPMTQILEESATNHTLNQSIGLTDEVQFILRTGYLKTYPEPVSLRRSVEEFVRT